MAFARLLKAQPRELTPRHFLCIGQGKSRTTGARDRETGSQCLARKGWLRDISSWGKELCMSRGGGHGKRKEHPVLTVLRIAGVAASALVTSHPKHPGKIGLA